MSEKLLKFEIAEALCTPRSRYIPQIYSYSLMGQTSSGKTTCVLTGEDLCLTFTDP